MDDAPPPERDLTALAASLKADERDSAVFFQVLCTTLADVLPGSTTVEREHGLMRRRRPARKVTVRLDTETFEAEMTSAGMVFHHVHASPGTGGGMPYAKVVGVNEWVDGIIATLSRVAADQSAATQALRSLTS